MKCFPFAIEWHTYFYDKQIVPVLRRMLNLEELTLYVSVIRTELTYIDGDQLYEEILNYLQRLNKFIFNINTKIINKRIGIDLP